MLDACPELQELAQCYQPGNGRPGIEPVVLLGVLIFQFLERVPDRQAAELGVRSFKDQGCGYVFILNDEMSSSASRSRYAS